MSEATTVTSAEAALAAAEAAVKQLEAAPAPTLTAGQALDQWLDTYVRNSPYARDTRVWNSIFNAVTQIKGALALANIKE